MPAAQVINLNAPEGAPTPLERTAESFTQRFMENKEKQRESDALKEIYSKYQNEGQMLEKTLMDINADTNISPTMKVNAANQLMQFGKYNMELQKKAKEDLERKAAREGLEKNRGLEPGSLAGLESNLNLAEKITRPEKGTQASQPVNPDQMKRIEHVTSNPEFLKKDPYEQNLMLMKAGVSKENAEAVMKPRLEQNKTDGERDKIITKKQAENDIAFVDEQAGKYQSLIARQQTVEAAEALNEQGVTGLAWDQAMQKCGLLQFTSEGYREFASYAKEMVKNANIKSVLGSQISQMEFGFFRDATISERFSKEANNQIIKKEKLAIRYDKLYSDITKKIIEENGGKIPPGIQSKVNEEFGVQSQKISKELKEVATNFNAIQNVPAGKVLMYDKKRRPLHVPADQVEKYSKPPYGASLS